MDKWYKSSGVLLAALACLSVHAQNVNDRVQRDFAEIDPLVILNFELLQIDMGIRNLDGASFNSGVWGIVEPVRGVGVLLAGDQFHHSG